MKTELIILILLLLLIKYNDNCLCYSHPKYRAALYARFPALACQPSPEENGSVASAATATEEKPSA